MTRERPDDHPDRAVVPPGDSAARPLASDLAVVPLDPEGRILDWGADAESLAGWTDEDVFGDPFTVLYPDGRPERERAEALSGARVAGRFEDERWCRRADGSRFWASVSITPRQSGGEPVGFTLVVQDRTDRKRIEDERALLAEVGRAVASAETFAEGVGTVLSAVCDHTQWAYGEAWVPAGDGHLEQLVAHAGSEDLEPFREASGTVTFRPGEGLPGRVLVAESPEWIPDASAESPEVFHRAAFADDAGLQAALGVPITTDDGVVAVLTFALRERCPADEELIEVVTDVAADLGQLVARKRAEEALEREQSLLGRIFETSPTGLVVTDTDRTVVRANSRAGEVFGLPESDLLGRPFDRLAEGFGVANGDPVTDGALPVESLLETGDPTALECEVVRTDGETRWVTASAAPIRASDGTVERVVVAIEDITEQKQRERTLCRQRDALERIKRIIESLRPINRELVRAGTREDIDAVVCEQLTTAEMYQFAWVGGYNAATERITPREWAGIREEFVRDLDLTLSGDGADGLYERAVSEGTVQARQAVTMESTDERDRALAYGYQSRAVVPMVYGETVHGVISVYSARPDAFGEYERGLLAELGERIGHAINAVENRQLLHTDTVVELEFEVDGGSPLVTAADALDCRLSLNNVVPASDSEYVCYVEVDGTDPEALADRLESEATVDRTRVVTARGETGVVESTGELGPATTLIEHGASVRSFEASAEGGTLIAETAPQSDVESIITDIESTHTGTVFTAKRTLDREVRTLRLTKTAVEEALTERQREALALAYHAGYFASPRQSTGQELADALGVSSPTFYGHVRKGLRKIVELTIDDRDPSSPTGSR